MKAASSQTVVAAFAIAALAIMTSGGAGVFASSHREAPLISKDPQADITDVYAFVSPDKSDTVTFISSFNPFESPAGGPNFHSFGDDVLYEINVDNNGDAVADVTYQYTFNTTTQNGNTFLYNTGAVNSLNDATLNVRQTYTLTRVKNGQSTVIAQNVPVAPANVGPKSFPNYAAVSTEAVKSFGSTTTFAGPTDDAFFVDLGGIFDLLTIRKLPGNAGGGKDYVAGYNVHTIALQVPITDVTKDGLRPADAKASNAVIGTWTTTSRKATRVLNSDGSSTHDGAWVQVARLGQPLVNEVVIPRGFKDKFNAAKPADDAQFANFVANPELGGLFKAIYGLKVPPQADFGKSGQRDDLITIFLTGIKDLNQPAGVKPSEELRLNVAIAPAARENSLGVVGGDTAGFPNGRRLADDVTDIALKVVAGAAYPLFHPEFTPDPLAAKLGDGVDRNDKSFRTSFPYIALPWSGYDSKHGFGADVDVPPGQTGCGCEIAPGLRLGNRGNHVIALQNCLKSKGLFPASIRSTGFFGATTDASVRACKAR